MNTHLLCFNLFFLFLPFQTAQASWPYEEPLYGDPEADKLGIGDTCSDNSECKSKLECVDYPVYFYYPKIKQCLRAPTQKMYNTCQKPVLREYNTQEGCEKVHMQKEVEGWQEFIKDAKKRESDLELRKQMRRYVDQIAKSERIHFQKHEYYVAAKSYPPLKSGTSPQPWLVEDSGGFWTMGFEPLPGRAGSTPQKVRRPEQYKNSSVIGSYSVKLIDKGFVVEVRSDLDEDGEVAIFRYNSVTGKKGWAHKSEL